MILEPGQEIDRFVVEGVLGEGGMAAVYRVRHQTLGSMYALKVLSIPTKSIRDRMLQEGRIQASMRAANVVQVQDVLDVGGMMGLLMEYVKGPSLDDYIKEYQLSLDDALKVFGGILAGVAVAHDKGLIHRDVKPANVLLHIADDGLWPKVTDFGIAKGTESAEPLDVTRPGTTMGTPAYMSPEQIQDASRVDTRADIWSLGCLLYELVCHRRVFMGDSILEILNSVVRGEFQRPEEIDPHLPPRVIDAINGCLRFDPEDRFPNVRALAACLAGVESCTSVGECLDRHLPRNSEMALQARSLAFKTPPPVPLRDGPTKKKPPTPGGDTEPGQSYSPPQATWHGKAEPANVWDTLGEGIPAVDLPTGNARGADAMTPEQTPGLPRRASMHDLDDGIEVMSTEEVEIFRSEASKHMRGYRNSVTGYEPPMTFMRLPIPVVLAFVIMLGITLGAGIRYKRILTQLDRLGSDSTVASRFFDDGHVGDTGLAIAEGGGSWDALPEGERAKAKAKRNKKRRQPRRNGSEVKEPIPLDELPDPVDELLAAKAADGTDEPGREETAEPDLEMPRKQWSRVRIEGDAKKVVFRAAGKDYYPPKLPPGEFDVIAWFGDDPVPAGRIFVGSEGLVKLRCSVIWQKCEVQ